MNILFITNSIGYGGAEKIMNFLTNQLCSENNNVTILNLNRVPQYVGNITQNLNPAITTITIANYIKNKNLRYIKSILNVIKDYDIDVMITFTMFPNFYGKVASLISGIPSIMSERGDPNKTFTNGLKDRIMKFFINRCSGAVFQTEGAASFYHKRLRKRSVIIPNPIKSEINIRHSTNTEREKSVVFVGRIENHSKRLDILLKAFKEFSLSHSDYVLKIFGSGEIDFVNNLIDILNLKDKVKLMGAVKDPTKLIINDGIFALTSDYEGIPNALLEAMAIGMPVVSTDCTPGGAKLLIKNRENGLLVPKGDIEKVADAFREFADNPDLAQKCGNNAQEVKEKFASERIGKEWINYIEKIVHSKLKHNNI